MDENGIFILKMFFAFIWVHFFADFILQTYKMALNKSKSWKWLAIHAFTYGIPFGLLVGFVHDWLAGLVYGLVNAILHGAVDAVTSRLTAWLWKQNQRHWFFVVIGLDQAIHITILFLSYLYLLGMIFLHFFYGRYF